MGIFILLMGEVEFWLMQTLLENNKEGTHTLMMMKHGLSAREVNTGCLYVLLLCPQISCGVQTPHNIINCKENPQLKFPSNSWRSLVDFLGKQRTDHGLYGDFKVWICCWWLPMSLVMLLAWTIPGIGKRSCSPRTSTSAPTDTSCQMMTDEGFKRFMVNLSIFMKIQNWGFPKGWTSGSRVFLQCKTYS